MLMSRQHLLVERLLLSSTLAELEAQFNQLNANFPALPPTNIETTPIGTAATTDTTTVVQTPPPPAPATPPAPVPMVSPPLTTVVTPEYVLAPVSVQMLLPLVRRRGVVECRSGKRSVEVIVRRFQSR